MPAESINGQGVLRDLEQGEEAIRLVDLPKQNFLPKKDGRAPHISACFRWAKRGLETLKTPAGLVTTRAAWFRYCAALSGIRVNQQNRTPAKRERQLDRAERELAAMGL
jgi:hypothetical protein